MTRKEISAKLATFHTPLQLFEKNKDSPLEQVNKETEYMKEQTSETSNIPLILFHRAICTD